MCHAKFATMALEDCLSIGKGLLKVWLGTEQMCNYKAIKFLPIPLYFKEIRRAVRRKQQDFLKEIF